MARRFLRRAEEVTAPIPASVPDIEPQPLTAQFFRDEIARINVRAEELRQQRSSLALALFEGSEGASATITEIDREHTQLLSRKELAEDALRELVSREHESPNLEHRITRGWDRLQRELQREVKEKRENAMFHRYAGGAALLDLIDLADPLSIAKRLVEGLLPRIINKVGISSLGLASGGNNLHAERNAFIESNAALLIEQTELPPLPDQLAKHVKKDLRS